MFRQAMRCRGLARPISTLNAATTLPKHPFVLPSRSTSTTHGTSPGQFTVHGTPDSNAGPTYNHKFLAKPATVAVGPLCVQHIARADHRSSGVLSAADREEPASTLAQTHSSMLGSWTSSRIWAGRSTTSRLSSLQRSRITLCGQGREQPLDSDCRILISVI